jgi:hypothetical protein
MRGRKERVSATTAAAKKKKEGRKNRDNEKKGFSPSLLPGTQG